MVCLLIFGEQASHFPNTIEKREPTPHHNKDNAKLPTPGESSGGEDDCSKSSLSIPRYVKTRNDI